jgi:TolA-binding protein
MNMKIRLALWSAILGTAVVSSGTLFVGATAAIAQDANVEGRVKKLEKEMQAVQRKVFPQGAGGFFEPEIRPETATQPNTNNNSSSAVSDLMSRVDALEAQLATLTGQVEQQGNSMRQMEQRLKLVEAGLKQQQAAASAPLVVAPTTTPPVRNATTTPPKTTTPAATPPKTGTVASNARTQAVAAIARPASGDAFEDSYSYGYRLWEAKYFPEAQVQLADTVKKYPKHARASYARNLLGRAWLDDKKPATAVKILYDNYKEDPRGERAPDSLFFLGVALTDLGKATEACEAFGQLATAYPDVAAGRLADRVASGRTRAKCK